MEKIYVWKVDIKEGKYWELISIAFWPQDFEKLEANKNDKWWVSLNLKDKKDWWKYLEVYVRQNEQKYEPSKPKEYEKINDIPF